MTKHYFKSKNCLVHFLLLMVLPCDMMTETTEPITTSRSFTVLDGVTSVIVEAWVGSGKGGSKAGNGNGSESNGNSRLFPGGVFCVLLIQDGTYFIKKLFEKLVFSSPILKYKTVI